MIWVIVFSEIESTDCSPVESYPTCWRVVWDGMDNGEPI